MKKSQVVIVNGKINANSEAKLKIQDDFNDGKYKVIIGTTESIGAGMDLQEDTIAIINIDIPYTPTSVTQRKGRGERPGNINKVISNINIFTRGSYDAWSASIVAIKKKWQDQLLEGNGDSVNGYLKNIGDEDFDINTIMAELIEDPKEKQKLMLQADVNLLEAVVKEQRETLEYVEGQMKAVDSSINERLNKIEAYKKQLKEKPDAKMPVTMIEKLQKTVDSLNIDLVELATKRDNVESALVVKEQEIKIMKADLQKFAGDGEEDYNDTETGESLVKEEKTVLEAIDEELRDRLDEGDETPLPLGNSLRIVGQKLPINKKNGKEI